MIRVVVDNAPVDVAWAAFDAAAISFHALYSAAADMERDDTGQARSARFEAAQEVARLWDEFRRLYVGDEPTPVA